MNLSDQLYKTYSISSPHKKGGEGVDGRAIWREGIWRSNPQRRKIEKKTFNIGENKCNYLQLIVV